MAIGWHHDYGTHNLVGRHLEGEPSRGPGTFAKHAMQMDPEQDFDWSAVEDISGEVMEAVPGLTRQQADMVVDWITSRGDAGVVGQARLLHRVLEWIANGRPEMSQVDPDGTRNSWEGMGETRLGARTWAVIRILLPDSRLAKMPIRKAAVCFGVTKGPLQYLLESFRAKFK